MTEHRNEKDQLHREGGPAVIDADGGQEWWLNGEPHREDGPAIIWPDGTQYWFINGKLHREDDPAIIYPNGSKQHWYINGKRHREGGPAVIWPDGTQEWWINGKRHRENGLPHILDKSKNTMTLANGEEVPMTDDDYEKYKYRQPSQFTKAALREI